MPVGFPFLRCILKLQCSPLNNIFCMDLGSFLVPSACHKRCLNWGGPEDDTSKNRGHKS